MPKNLLIVESPAKAKTIEKYLGKDFSVKSSYGHIRDLEKSNISVDVENNFNPNYIITPDKKKLVKELKDAVKKVDEVWLATDEDREGEAISWHLCKVLGLDERETKRIVFREITKNAIQKAVEEPRTLDLNLVDAQQARRILDRLVGYELSGILWKKIKGSLSAGRVQSVSVKLVVEKEREIQKFKPTPFYKITAIFTVLNGKGKKVELKAELPKRMENAKDVEGFLKNCISASFNIKNIEVKPLIRKPTAPFTTSTLQQEASRKLGFSVKRTMTNAQRLYEQGHISYMRTDSINLSDTALGAIAAEIKENYGEEYLNIRKYKSKNNSAQEAHEAIRPTDFKRKMVTNDRDQQRLYELIWKRTVASQMSNAKLEKTIVNIGISTMLDEFLKAEGEVLKFDGFLKVYMESTDDEESEAKGMLPPLKLGQALDLKEMKGVERFTRPPSRYTEAGLVKKLEELGIGRPSTYAPTISKIMEEKRGYVIKGNSEGKERNYDVYKLENGTIEHTHESEMTGAIKNRLVPTDMGMIVTDFLEEHFGNIMDYAFTAGIEKQFDDISEGKMEWPKMLGNFYFPFHEKVTGTIENAERASGERKLGKDPETGRTVLVRMSRFGKPIVQIGAPDELTEDEKPKYGNLSPGLSLETVSFEQAMDAFKLPKSLGEYKGKEVVIGLGRFGPYVKHGESFFASIPRGEDALGMEKDRAIEIIEEKLKADAPIGTYESQPITKGKGRFGPFVKWNGMFVNIPRKYDPEALTVEEAIELIKIKVEKEANRYIHQWPEEKISVENGRWGPFIRFGKKNVKLPKVEDKRMTSEEAKDLSLEDVKKLIEAELPGSFKKAKPKSKAKAKKAVKK